MERERKGERVGKRRKGAEECGPGGLRDLATAVAMTCNSVQWRAMACNDVPRVSRPTLMGRRGVDIGADRAVCETEGNGRKGEEMGREDRLVHRACGGDGWGRENSYIVGAKRASVPMGRCCAASRLPSTKKVE